MIPHGLVARFDDCTPGGDAIEFSAPAKLLVAHRPEEVRPLLAELEDELAGGAWAAGYLAYEAAAGLGLPVRRSASSELPLVWFALFDEPVRVPAVRERPGPVPYRSTDWCLELEQARYAERVQAIRTEIERGETYQANLTTNARGQVHGDLFEFYRDLALAQRGAFSSYLDIGDYVVASASPELFFSLVGRTITTGPMKGTARRAAEAGEDLARARALLASEKDRAENLMIVDLMRNDLGRIARYGSVTVPELFALERYETVWQLTSRVTARLEEEIGIAAVFEALFPAGSITGAPKRRSMEILAGLEDHARGVYCGAIGYLAPARAPMQARFAVAIRTAVIERKSGRARYGAGGAITWSSEPAAEYEEVLAKTAILSARPSEFALIETLAVEPRRGPRDLDRHLDRLERSATYFGFELSRSAVATAIDEATIGTAHELRVRVQLERDGTVAVTTSPLVHARAPVSLAVDIEPIDSRELWRYHKTTRREAYELRAERHPEADDVIMVNERGELTETAIANLALFIDGAWYTPPLSSGCLPGVGRALALESGRCIERVLHLDDLERADAIAVLSSLRGWRRALLCLEPALIA